MTKKEKIAETMGKVLEDKYGWNVFETARDCPKCHKNEGYHSNYCSNCGAKMSLDEDEKNKAFKALYDAFEAGKKVEASYDAREV